MPIPFQGETTKYFQYKGNDVIDCRDGSQDVHN